MTSRRCLWAIAFALALVTAAQAEDADIVITISGGKFMPSEVSVPANTKVKLIVRNRDTSISEFESIEMHREKTVAPGQEISVFVGPLDAGDYEFFDDFHPQNRGHLVAK